MSDPEITILGLGAFSLGMTAVGAYGFFEEPTTPEGDGVRILAPGTGDYLTDGGIVQRASTARQRVIIAVSTLFGSSMAVRGVQFDPVHDVSTPRVTEQEIREALRPIVEDGSINLEQIQISVRNQGIAGRLGISVSFFDNQTGELDTVEA